MSQRKAEAELMKRIINLHGTDGYVVADPVDNSLEWFPKAEFNAIPYDTTVEKAKYFIDKFWQAINLLDKAEATDKQEKAEIYKCKKMLDGTIKYFNKFINERIF